MADDEQNIRETVRRAWINKLDSLEQSEVVSDLDTTGSITAAKIEDSVDNKTLTARSALSESASSNSNNSRKRSRRMSPESERGSSKLLKVEEISLLSSDLEDTDDDDLKIISVTQQTNSNHVSDTTKFKTGKRSSGTSKGRAFHSVIPPPFNVVHNEYYDDPRLPNSITLRDILGSPQLKTAYLFSYQYSLEYIAAQFLNFNKTKVVLFYQPNTHVPCGNPNVVEIEVPMAPYTSHHSKMIINEYQDGSVKLWIVSCNLVQAEFEMNNQLYWSSPLLYPGEDKSSQFKRKLSEQIMTYPQQYPPLNRLIQSLDFKPIVGDFIPSARSRQSDKFGFFALYESLLEHKAIPYTHDVHRKLLYQSSSISSPYQHSTKTGLAANIFTHFLAPLCLGYFGQNPHFKNMHINAGTTALEEMSEKSNAELLVVYSSSKCVKSSLFGVRGGGWSCYNPTTVKGKAQSKVLDPIFHKSITKQRRTNPSHSKFVVMTSDNFKTLDWVLFTSHNISKQAWGNPLSIRSTGMATNVENYETGVLITSDHYPGKRLIPVEVGESYDMGEDEVPIILPFRVPPPKYEPDDTPWCVFEENQGF